MPYLLLLFVIMPIAEIAVLINVGGAIGGWTTIGIVILTAVLGTFMLRQQGLSTLAKAQTRLQAGEMPAQQMLEGMLLLIGGVLLLTPGFITDFIGFCTLVPWSREFLAKQLASRSIGGAKVFVGGSPFAQSDAKSDRPSGPVSGPGGRNSGNSRGAGNASDPNSVIDGDYERLD